VDGKFTTMKKGLPSQGSGYLSLINNNRKELSVQVKINHVSESETSIYSWHPDPHGSEQVDP
jgi:hypothetical protein